MVANVNVVLASMAGSGKVMPVSAPEMLMNVMMWLQTYQFFAVVRVCVHVAVLASEIALVTVAILEVTARIKYPSCLLLPAPTPLVIV